ncbi:hypothetical protein CVT24_004782 [Panaeolus cyanescens]|uniref:Right handed beta helix domain-containing protein n=1 Tax=Panaeolus cyanescens TaxID=181874 RepID=A0A409V9V3_9AGAR|nr:hypothetical protein CVT24_004782 [Panaeolus cyanescens]
MYTQMNHLLVLLTLITSVLTATVDLTTKNRRPPIPGLPDWSKVGYEQGKALPGNNKIRVIPNDGIDDTDGLQRAIKENPGSHNSFTLIQLPTGTINLSYTIYFGSNYIILRGAGNDPSAGTVISFSPDDNTKYDVLTPNGDNIKGYMADQTKDIAGYAGTRKIYVDAQNASWTVGRSPGFDVWVGTDAEGVFINVDHDLAWNVYSTSVSGNAEPIQNTTTYTKIVPIQAAHHIGIEDLYMTQPMPGLSAEQAAGDYGNLAPESAMHGIVFRFAKHCWVKNIRTFMTGSHPIATEGARYLQIQDNHFEGSWNKGAGGNGYLRGSRVWDSLFYNNTLRDLRHFSFQWSAMRNVATFQNLTCDINLHGGYESYNLMELNYVSVPYNHRSASCSTRCGGDEGVDPTGTWAPIYWSAGDKASKWAGASGPQNVFFRNYMAKAFTPNGTLEEYFPYSASNRSTANKIWQFGWDRITKLGSHYQHLSLDGGVTLLRNWSGNERQTYDKGAGVGVNGQRSDGQMSLFFRDVKKALGGHGGHHHHDHGHGKKKGHGHH